MRYRPFMLAMAHHVNRYYGLKHFLTQLVNILVINIIHLCYKAC